MIANTVPQLEQLLLEVAAERRRQDEKWGEQNHPDGTGPAYRATAEVAKAITDRATQQGAVTWRHILGEEVAEAYAEQDPAALRAELVQVAAVALSWCEAIARREAAQ